MHGEGVQINAFDAEGFVDAMRNVLVGFSVQQQFYRGRGWMMQSLQLF